MNTISYQNIADSIDFYEKLGYTNVELPWYVTRDIMNITRQNHDYQLYKIYEHK